MDLCLGTQHLPVAKEPNVNPWSTLSLKMYSNHSNGDSVTRASSDAINGSAKHGMKKIRRSFAETKAQYSVFALYTL